jgi:hypothetical protein
MSSIIGYRKLTDKQHDLVNEIKRAEMAVLDLVEAAIEESADKRWAAIAKTDMERGFMSLVRAVTRPE